MSHTSDSTSPQDETREDRSTGPKVDSVELDRFAALASDALRQDIEGGQARFMIEAQYNAPLRLCLSPTQPGTLPSAQHWEASRSPLDLPLDWKPIIEYRVEPNSKGARIGFELQGGTDLGVSATGFKPDGLPNDYFEYTSPVESALARLLDSVGNPDAVFSSLPVIRAIKASAREQKERHIHKATGALQRSRRILNALVWIALIDALSPDPDAVLPDLPSDDERAWLLPTVKEPTDSFWKQRESIGETYTPLGRFLGEIRKFWDFLLHRKIERWQLVRIGKDAGLPEPLFSAAKNALQVLRRQIGTVDDEMVSSAAMETVCGIAEAYIIESDTMPTLKEVMPEVSRKHHNRTIHAGALLKKYKKKGQLPDFSRYGDLTEWLSNALCEEEGDCVHHTAVATSLKEAGCWMNTAKGATHGLPETVDAVIRYSQQKREK